MSEAIVRAGKSGEIVQDRKGSFGAVLGTLPVNSPAAERIIRKALDDALDKAVSTEAASVLNASLDPLDSMRRRARDQRWIGWESLHAPDPA